MKGIMNVNFEKKKWRVFATLMKGELKRNAGGWWGGREGRKKEKEKEGKDGEG